MKEVKFEDGPGQSFEGLKEYKGCKYGSDPNGVWFVQLSEEGARFLVALDDSKRCGKRVFDEAVNNEAACLRFIDWRRQVSK